MTWGESRLHWIWALVVLVVTQVVYLQTMTVTCPFWDSGEFIATSYILGIPHPPGTPLYVLIGRVFSLVPIFPQVATRVNWLSAVSSSLAAMFTYLLTVELWLRSRGGSGGAGVSGCSGMRGGEGGEGGLASGGFGLWGGGFGGSGFLGVLWSHWPGVVAGLVGAFFTAFGRTFWDNAIEAEVYALSSLLMSLSVWLILRWARWGGDRRGKNGLFVLLYYLICLSMGIHLGTFLVLPGILLFVLLVDRRSFGLGWFGAVLVAGLLLLLHPGMLPTLGLGVWGPLVLLVLLLGLFLGGRWPALGGRGIVTFCVWAALLGISTHFYLMIRAGLDPAINEADPERWGALWKVLTRDQYRPPNPFFERQASWGLQFGRHFWEYARDQYSLGLRPVWLGWLLPYGLGMWGAWGQARRDWRGFGLQLVTYLVSSVGLVFYLNFKPEEVRPRDYFFVASFQFYAVWIGLGAGWLTGWMGRGGGVRRMVGAAASGVGAASGAVTASALRSGSASVSGSVVDSVSGRWEEAAGSGGGLGSRLLGWGAGVLLILVPFSTVRNSWFEHDRTEFWVARDFAYNMLTPLKPNAILFTNGDNDTFPLWYLQQVEKIRTDVVVANLSLLNTAWYLRQLRDYEPKVNLGWSDDEVDAAEFFSTAMTGYRLGMVPRDRLVEFLQSTGLQPYVRSLDEPLMTRDVAVARIVSQEYGRRPLYIALTVPDAMGLESRLVQRGIAFEIEEPADRPERVDVDETVRLLTEHFEYRSLLTPEGRHDGSVYKDENARRLVQNYSAAALAAVQELRAAGRLPEAERMMTLAKELAPDSAPVIYSLAILKLDMKKWPEAAELLREVIALGGADARLHRLLGNALEGQGLLNEAEAEYRRALQASPGSFDAMRDLFSLVWTIRGDREAGLRVLDEWLQRHPEDARVRGIRDFYADSIR